MIAFRQATLTELDQVLGWAAEEGWNPGLDDAPAFLAADADGFFVAVGDDNQPIAAISVVNHTPGFAFLGLYLVRPEFRGQGIGLALWNRALQHAGNRTIGLDGVEDQQSNYRASGFAVAGATTRFSGQLEGQFHAAVKLADAQAIPQLIQMEAAASGVAKPDYLSAWFSDTATRATYVLRSEQETLGFATLRECRSGAKIGPLVAVDESSAHMLLTHAAAIADGPVTIDVPEHASGLTQLCHQLNLKAGFRTARMYRGEAMSPTPEFFAVTTLELG